MDFAGWRKQWGLRHITKWSRWLCLASNSPRMLCLETITVSLMCSTNHSTGKANRFTLHVLFYYIYLCFRWGETLRYSLSIVDYFSSTSWVQSWVQHLSVIDGSYTWNPWWWILVEDFVWDHCFLGVTDPFISGMAKVGGNLRGHPLFGARKWSSLDSWWHRDLFIFAYVSVENFWEMEFEVSWGGSVIVLRM